jgi:hypothetical protein
VQARAASAERFGDGQDGKECVGEVSDEEGGRVRASYGEGDLYNPR